LLDVQLNLSITRATNETRAFPGSGGKAHSSTRTRRILGNWGVSKMGRAIVEEIATLASLALFVGMIAMWAQVLATL
jgi:hypothetical protein